MQMKKDSSPERIRVMIVADGKGQQRYGAAVHAIDGRGLSSRALSKAAIDGQGFASV